MALPFLTNYIQITALNLDYSTFTWGVWEPGIYHLTETSPVAREPVVAACQPVTAVNYEGNSRQPCNWD